MESARFSAPGRERERPKGAPLRGRTEPRTRFPSATPPWPLFLSLSKKFLLFLLLFLSTKFPSLKLQMDAERLVPIIRRERRQRVRGVHGALRGPVVVAHTRRGIDLDVRHLSGAHDAERDDAARAFGGLRLEPVSADEREELLHIVCEREFGVERCDGRPEGNTRARGVAVRGPRGARELESRPDGLHDARSGLRFLGLCGLLRLGHRFRGREDLFGGFFDHGLRLRRRRRLGGRGNGGGRRRGLGPAEGGGAHDANGQGHRDEDRRLARLAQEENEREERRVRENRGGGREGARGEAGARSPREDVRNGERAGVSRRARLHGAPSLLSSVTIPRLSTPSRLRVSMVSTTPYARLRSAFRYTALSRRRERMRWRRSLSWDFGMGVSFR